MNFERFGCQDLKATAPIYRGLAWVNMGKYKPFGEGAAINQAGGTNRKKQIHLPNSISLFVCTVFAQINLYVFTTPLLNITGTNLTPHLRWLSCSKSKT
jgi:hypothetical protein